MSNQLVFVQPVFAPSRGQLDLNLNSLNSLREYLIEQSKTDTSRFDILLGGWCINEQYWDEIIKVCDSFPQDWNISLRKFTENVGKATIVNFLLKNYFKENKDIKYIFTCDSDMVFLKEHRMMFNRGIVAMQVAESVRKMKPGYIAFNQEEDNCHWVNHMDLKVQYKIESLELTEMLAWPSSKCGIAGGALLISKEGWDAVGGYSVGNQAYHGEDGFMLRDLQLAGFSTSILMTCAVKHPKQNDLEYIEWKKQAMLQTHDVLDLEKQKENIKATEEFWRKKSDTQNLQQTN